VTGATIYSPSVAIGEGSLFLTVTGTDSKLYLHIMDLTTGSWQQWVNLGGSYAVPPSSVILPTPRLSILIVNQQDFGIFEIDYP
jgi:hypothetical protein